MVLSSFVFYKLGFAYLVSTRIKVNFYISKNTFDLFLGHVATVNWNFIESFTTSFRHKKGGNWLWSSIKFLFTKCNFEDWKIHQLIQPDSSLTGCVLFKQNFRFTDGDDKQEPDKKLQMNSAEKDG